MRWLIIFLLVMPIMYAECWEKPVTDSYYYHNNKFFAKNIELKDFVKIEQDEYAIIISNELEVPITLEIMYNRKSEFFHLNKNISIVKTIEPKEKKVYEDTFGGTIGCGTKIDCSIDLINYEYVEPNKIKKLIKVKYIEECSNPWLIN